MTVRLGYVMELLIVLASGMALSRWATQVLEVSQFRIPRDLAQLSQYFTEPFLVGVSLAGGMGLGVEAVRRKSPATWGIGRRAWAIAALTIAFGAIAWVAEQVVILWKPREPFYPRDELFAEARHVVMSSFYQYGGWFMAALGLTSLFDGHEGDPEPDAREWAGRSLLILVVAQSIALRILGIYRG